MSTSIFAQLMTEARAASGRNYGCLVLDTIKKRGRDEGRALLALVHDRSISSQAVKTVLARRGFKASTVVSVDRHRKARCKACAAWLKSPAKSPKKSPKTK